MKRVTVLCANQSDAKVDPNYCTRKHIPWVRTAGARRLRRINDK
jgi:hypothetical protein